MQTETVAVRLIVAADGALRTLDQFDSAMTDSANASVKAGAGVDAMTRQIERMRKAQEAGVPVLKARAAAISYEERVLNSVLGKADAVTHARIQAERELARAATAASNLVIQGKLSEAEATRQLLTIEAAHAAAVDRAIADAGRLAAANNAVVDSYQRRAAGSNINAANIGYQFQDIGVTAAMGMSPLMIGLQQGTQLSSVFAGQTLRQSIAGVGTALASIASPISIATIGLAALSAAGIQWAMSMTQDAGDATSALERHSDMLDKVLAGYSNIRDAADQALASALRMPQASTQSNLGAERDNAAERALAAMQRALDLRSEFEGYVGYGEAFGVPAETIAALERTNAVITAIAADGALSRAEMDQLHTSLTRLGNNTADTNIRDIAKEALALVDAARAAAAEVASLDAGLTAIDRDIQIRIRVSQEFSSAIGDLSSLYQDPRSRFDQMREQAKNAADQAMATATSYGQAVGAAAEFERVMASINAAEAEAAKRATGSAGGGPASDPWADSLNSFQQRIASQRLELSLLGETTYEAERQRAAFELLNQAKQAGVAITPELEQQANALASEYAALTAEIERQQQTTQMWENAAKSFVGALKDGKLEMSEMLDIALNLAAQFLKMSMPAMGGGNGNILGTILGAFAGGFSNGGSGVVGGVGSGVYRPGAADNTLFVAKAQRGEPFAFGRQAVTGIGGKGGNTVHVTIQNSNTFAGAMSDKDVANMVRAENQQTAAQIVESVKRNLPGWNASIQTYGAA